MKRHAIEVANLIIVLLHVGCAPNTAMTQPEKPQKPAIVSGEPSYTVIKNETLPPIWRKIEVDLSCKVHEDALRKIAVQLKNADPKTYERTLIFYHIPEWKQWKPKVFWATTNFDPDLKVCILGM